MNTTMERETLQLSISPKLHLSSRARASAARSRARTTARVREASKI